MTDEEKAQKQVEKIITDFVAGERLGDICREHDLKIIEGEEILRGCFISLMEAVSDA